MVFATTFVLEQEPLQWWELPAAIKGWVQIAGAVAAFALAIFCLAYAIRRPAYASKTWSRQTRGVALLIALCGASYVLALLAVIGRGMGIGSAARNPGLLQAQPPPPEPVGTFSGLVDILLFVAGLFAILAVTLPLLVDLCTRIRFGRVLAIARLSVKEAVRSRVVWVFASMAIIFLFADWFVPYKPEDQVRNYVRVIYWSLAPLFLLTASLLGAFSIPADVKSQSIHTIVTKPVERFEIVLGRFCGYAALLTVGIGFLTAISLLYVARGVTPQAAKESFTARVPIYGDVLSFSGTGRTDKGESVGREWDYRSYISGPRVNMPQAPRQYAIWSFASLPVGFSETRLPYFEFTFDIFRLTKGQENRGVITNFSFVDGRYQQVPQFQAARDKMRDERARAQDALAKAADAKSKQGSSTAAIQTWRSEQQDALEDSLIDKFGIYEVTAEVLDYHTQVVGGDDKDKVGRKLARLLNMLQDPAQVKSRTREDGATSFLLNVMVSVDRQSAEQMLGVAKRDLYLLAAERPFWLNFIKGVMGMWFATLLMLGLAVALSTYLSGVIAWLCALFLFGMGLFSDSIRQIAEGTSYGGGVVESTVRILGKLPGGARLENSPAASVITGSDEVFRFFLRLFARIIPDVGRFDLHAYVANGYDISWMQVLFLDNFVVLLGYLLPWAVLAYYLMKYREVANPM
ncbi:MAG: hypothetical protein FJ271_08915 [Planctomycetes bacterium]|nr:hypothetical protein [Planctomycetota bacterium]